MTNTPALKIVRSWRKTLTLQVLPDRTIMVKAPYFTPRYAIHSFVEKNDLWIQKKLAALETVSLRAHTGYWHGDAFLFLGKSYTLTIGEYDGIVLRGEKFQFPRFLLFRIEKEIEQWYINQARQIIKRQVEWHAKQMNVSYISISFSDTRSKWGSCTHHNKLQFNWRVVMAPMEVVDYLVIHELTHILEKNHSARFWQIVRRMDPSYKIQNKWLKKYGDTLMLYHQIESF